MGSMVRGQGASIATVGVMVLFAFLVLGAAMVPEVSLAALVTALPVGGLMFLVASGRGSSRGRIVVAWLSLVVAVLMLLVMSLVLSTG